MKTSSRRGLPSRASTTATASPRAPSLAFLGLLFSLAAILLLAAACTRDRPIELISTPTPSTALLPAPLLETPQPLNAGGEPLVQALPVDGAAGATETIQLREDGRTIGSYTVVSGDTVLSVAIAFNSSAEEIRELNLMTDDLIQVGQVLRVPIFPPTPEPTPEPFYHLVVAGDSLISIANTYGVSQIDLITANLLPDPNALRAGMQLIIPGYKPAVPAGSEGSAPIDPSAMGTHIVEAGESLGRIAALYNITVSELMAANGLTDRNNVRTGVELLIPGLTQADALRRRSIEHVVQAGESLSIIAQQYGQTVDAIMRMNAITDPNSVRTGQVLYIPPVN